MQILTLTTDFGLKDSFVGTMKGVILGICPEAHVVDISHLIAPQNVLEAALVLRRAYSYFPSGTVHVAVIDPGVGTPRRALAARLGVHFFVGPDNGLLTLILMEVERNGWPREIVHITNERYFLPQVSHTFHGRDIFAPAAAHLANGVPLTELGSLITDPLLLPMPKPERTPTGWRVHIIAIDTFGNLTTDLPAMMLKGQVGVKIHLSGWEVRGLADSYGRNQPGDLIALADSDGYLELAVVNGNAAQVTQARLGDVIDVVMT
jgi:S-adenosylmethionine hydrolase